MQQCEAQTEQQNTSEGLAQGCWHESSGGIGKFRKSLKVLSRVFGEPAGHIGRFWRYLEGLEVLCRFGSWKSSGRFWRVPMKKPGAF